MDDKRIEQIRRHLKGYDMGFALSDAPAMLRDLLAECERLTTAQYVAGVHVTGTYPDDAVAALQESGRILQEDNASLHGVIEADEQRLIAAAERAGIVYVGCDTPDALADVIVKANATIAALASFRVEKERLEAFRANLSEDCGNGQSRCLGCGTQITHDRDCPVDLAFFNPEALAKQFIAIRGLAKRQHEGLLLADVAINHMGDALNEVEACEPDDEAVTTPAFEAVAALLTEGRKLLGKEVG